MIQIKEVPNGNNANKAKVVSGEKSVNEDVVEEVCISATKEEIEGIVSSREDQKTKGSKTFTSGEYTQTFLFYTMTLDRTVDLPDTTYMTKKLSHGGSLLSSSKLEQLFLQHIVLSN